MDQLEAEPSDVGAQRRTEEEARQQAMIDNLEYALECTPELFGRVML